MTNNKQIEIPEQSEETHNQFEMDQDYLKSEMDKPKNKNNIIKCVTSKLFIIGSIFGGIVVIILCISLLVSYQNNSEVVQTVDFYVENLPNEQKIWFEEGIEELRDALKVVMNTRRARNVILFVGDGMGPNTVTASRILKSGEEGLLSWEKFPHMGMLKTYCADKQVPDSFSTGTALFSGVKINYGTGGVDSSVKMGNCSASLNKEHQVQSIINWAQIDGMKTGFVTTTRVMHATPAALYAHVPNRRWECESKISDDDKRNGCKDIARILIEDEPGKNINVIMGGGRQCLVSNVNSSDADPIDTWACYSTDGRDLINDWKKDKENRNKMYAFVSNNEELQQVNTVDTEFLLGIFANGHLKYDYQRDAGPKGMPSLKDMTTKAINLLKTKNKGFLLVVEGGMIDQAHHRGNAKKALTETLAFDEAVKATLDIMKNELSETLIIVTADHSHTLTINGYPDRGNSILGIASKSKIDKIPFTTLTYGTSYHGYQIEKDEITLKTKRRDPSQDDTESFDYIQQSTIYTDENNHGGSDVTIHAIGPMAHLFHRIHEQSYVAHVISFALRIGRFSESAILESLAEMLGL